MYQPLLHTRNNQINVSSIYIALTILSLLSTVPFGYTTQYPVKWAIGNHNNINVWINPYKICLQNNTTCYETSLTKWRFINSAPVCEFYSHYMKPMMASTTIIYFLLSVGLIVGYVKKNKQIISISELTFIITTLFGSINYTKWIFECKTKWVELENVVLVVNQPVLHNIFTYLLIILWIVSGIIVVKYIVCLHEYYKDRELISN